MNHDSFPENSNREVRFSGEPPSDEEFFSMDYEAAYLTSLFAAIAADLRRLESWLDWEDPEGPGVEIDQIEHHLGIGLVAIQRYMASVCTWMQVEKDLGLRLGPKVRNELPLAAVLNAGANHWKHELDEDAWNPHKKTKQTLEAFGFIVPKRYVAANLLSELGVASLTELLGRLKEWRAAVLEHAKRCPL